MGETEAAKKAVEVRVGELESELASLGGDKSGLANALAKAESAVTELREDVAAAAKAKEGLDGQVASLSEQLRDVQSMLVQMRRDNLMRRGADAVRAVGRDTGLASRVSPRAEF